MTPGDRVRISESSCVWPERRGLQATVVAPPTDGTYPQPAKGEVLLHIERDPLGNGEVPRKLRWSCVMSASSVIPMPGLS